MAARFSALSVRSVETEGNGKVLFKRGQKVLEHFENDKNLVLGNGRNNWRKKIATC